MGSKLWGADIIALNMLRPMFNAYSFNQYETAAKMLYQMNAFLLGFGEGVKDLPQPLHITTSAIDRHVPSQSFKIYYEKYVVTVMIKVGKFIREVLDNLPNQIYIPTEPTEA